MLMLVVVVKRGFGVRRQGGLFVRYGWFRFRLGPVAAADSQEVHERRGEHGGRYGGEREEDGEAAVGGEE